MPRRAGWALCAALLGLLLGLAPQEVMGKYHQRVRGETKRLFGGLKKGNLKVHVPDAKRKEAEELMCGEKWKRGEECMMDWSKYEDPDAIKEQEEEYERQQDMAEL